MTDDAERLREAMAYEARVFEGQVLSLPGLDDDRRTVLKEQVRRMYGVALERAHPGSLGRDDWRDYVASRLEQLCD